jgi:hypothetical protein
MKITDWDARVTVKINSAAWDIFILRADNHPGHLSLSEAANINNHALDLKILIEKI